MTQKRPPLGRFSYTIRENAHPVLVSDLLTHLREACAEVAAQARWVGINGATIPGYAATLPLAEPPGAADEQPANASREDLAAFWLTLDAVNFGSGWFPTLRKPHGRSGYHTIAAGIRERFETRGPWSAEQLQAVRPEEIAAVLGQDPHHELMGLFAGFLNDLGRHIASDHGGRFAALVDSAGGSAQGVAERLADWDCFRDVSTYGTLRIPFLKRAQITAADLARAGVADFTDLDRLTMFADNLVPHVLRLDGVLRFDPDLVARIDAGELIEHGSPAEVEIRACALHAVELLVAQRPGTRAASVDQVLWLRGQEARYKDSPRHRSRCTAY